MTLNFKGEDLPSFDDLYQFIKSNYLHSRFEGRDNWFPGVKYSDVVVQGYMDTLSKGENGLISHFESRSGKVIEFDKNLVILNPDVPPTEIPYRGGSITNPMSGIW